MTSAAEMTREEAMTENPDFKKPFWLAVLIVSFRYFGMVLLGMAALTAPGFIFFNVFGWSRSVLTWHEVLGISVAVSFLFDIVSLLLFSLVSDVLWPKFMAAVREEENK